jgi:spoIIIJ-associated protein
MKDFKIVVEELLNLIGFSDASVQIKDSKDKQTTNINIQMPEEEMGALIGHHGETIASLQLLLSLIYNKDQEDWKRVTVDIGDYRKKREEVLIEMAKKASDNAKTTGKEVILSYLPSHERRIIHLFLEEDSQIETYSEGVGKYRRLVIKPK